MYGVVWRRGARHRRGDPRTSHRWYAGQEDRPAAVTGSVVLLSVSADVVLSLALAAAVANPRLSQLERPVIATFVFVCAWLGTAEVDALRGPSWTVCLGGSVVVGDIVVNL